MTDKTYSTNGNAGAAARVVLGAGAKRNIHFTTTPVGDGSRFTWAAIEGAPAVETDNGFKPAKKASVATKKAGPAKKVTAVKPAKKAKGERKRGDGTIGHTPSAQAYLALVRRAAGATYEDASARLGVENHTVRGMKSRLQKEGFIFKTEKVNGKAVITGGTAPKRKSGGADEGLGVAA